METRSPYRNPLTRLETNQPAKTFKVFTSAGSAAMWLKEKSNADKVCRDARGKMKVRTWADGHVVITMFGAVRHPYRLNLAPARYLTPAAYANENYERLHK